MNPMNVSGFIEHTLETMKEHPGLLGLSFNFFTLFVLQCVDEWAKRSGPTLSEASYISPLTITSDSDATAVSSLLISDYEKTTFYNGINPGGDHPVLFYRSDLLTNPFPVPKGRHASLPTKSARPVYDTLLNGCWDNVAPKIVTLLKNQNIRYSAIDPVRFFTHGPGEEDKGTLGPVTMWIALHPGTTTIEAAHDASLGILELLKANGVEDAVVEWREGAPEKLSGPALLRVVNNTNPTYHVRRFLTAALGVSIAPATKENDDAQGSVAFFFHENRNKDGTPVDTVLGVSNCHVLSKDSTVDYEFKRDGARPQSVRVNGFRRFQRALEEIKDCISAHAIEADCLARGIIALEAKPKSEDPEEAEEDVEALVKKRAKLTKEKEDIATLEKFYKEVLNSQWGDIEHRNIGYVHWAPKISVDAQDRKYTKDIATFVVDPTKFKTQFKGNVVSLGSKYTAHQLASLFYAPNGGSTTFKFPSHGQLRINGWVTREMLANLDCYDSNGERCLIVMKDGNTTDLTVGRYAGLESYLCDDTGLESIELAIYNHDKLSGPFSAKGDSGSLAFDGQGRMVGILHSGMSKGGSSYVTYALPAWWAVEELKKRYPYADFNRTSF